MPSLFARPRWAAHACVAPTIVNNNPKTVELTRRPPPTLRGCVRDAGAATLMCARKFGEYAFLEDSRYTSQREICGARRFIRRACGGSRRLRRPLPACGERAARCRNKRYWVRGALRAAYSCAPHPHPLPASGGERECTEIAARPLDHSNADRVGRHEADYSLISRLKRSINAPRCGLSLSQSMVRILARSSWVLAIASVIAPSSFTFELVGITS